MVRLQRLSRPELDRCRERAQLLPGQLRRRLDHDLVLVLVLVLVLDRLPRCADLGHRHRGHTSVALSWTAPGDVGQDAISDDVVQYALVSSPTSWTTFDDEVSTDTSATVTDLVNGPATSSRSSRSTPSAMALPPPRRGRSRPADRRPRRPSTRSPGRTAACRSRSRPAPRTARSWTNGTSYAVQVRANNAVGSGTPSPRVGDTADRSGRADLGGRRVGHRVDRRHLDRPRRQRRFGDHPPTRPRHTRMPAVRRPRAGLAHPRQRRAR